MKRSHAFCSALLVSYMFCLPISLADGPQVAVLDVDRVLDAYPEAAMAEADLQRMAEKFEDELEADRLRIDALRKELEQLQSDAGNAALRDEARAELRESAMAKLAELREADMHLRQKMQRLQRQLNETGDQQRNAIFQKIQAWAGVVAREKGVDLVLDGSFMSPGGTPLVLYSSSAVDITDAVIDKIPAKAGEKQP